LLIEGSEPDPDPYLLIIYPDPVQGGPKTYGSAESGTATLAKKLFKKARLLLDLHEGLPRSGSIQPQDTR
jgi:hypothetical protein